MSACRPAPARPPRTGRARSGPPPGWPNTAPPVADWARPTAAAGRSRPGPAAPRGRGPGRRPPPWRRARLAVVARAPSRRRLPRDHVGVRDDEVRRDDEAAALLDPAAGLRPRPSPSSRDLRRSRSTRTTLAAGGAGASGRGLQGVEHLRGSVSPTSWRSACERVGRRREQPVDRLAIADVRACSAGQSGTSASAGQQQPQRDEHAEHAGERAAATRSTCAPSRAEARVQTAPDDSPSAWPRKAPPISGCTPRRAAAVLGRGPRCASSTMRQQPRRDEQPERHAEPRDRPGRRSRGGTRGSPPIAASTMMSRSSAVHRRAPSRYETTSRRRREEAGVGHHPVVGAHGLALDVPACGAAPRSSRPCANARCRRAPRGAARPA